MIGIDDSDHFLYPLFTFAYLYYTGTASFSFVVIVSGR